MDRFSRYVHDLFEWNEQMKQFLNSEKVSQDSELWEKLDDFAELIESTDRDLSNEELLFLQTKAEHIHEHLEDYFKENKKKGLEPFG